VNAHRAVVPVVKISAMTDAMDTKDPDTNHLEVDVGEPFSITVTASAPYGLI